MCCICVKHSIQILALRSISIARALNLFALAISKIIDNRGGGQKYCSSHYFDPKYLYDAILPMVELFDVAEGVLEPSDKTTPPPQSY